MYNGVRCDAHESLICQAVDVHMFRYCVIDELDDKLCIV